jgi:hypothetical protein
VPDGEAIPLGECIAIAGIHTTWHEIRVRRPDGGSTNLPRYAHDDPSLNGYQPSELDIEVRGSFDDGGSTIQWSSLIGQPCQSGDPLPISSYHFSNAWRYLDIAYTIGCVPAADIYDPQERAECQRTHDPDIPICTTVDPATSVCSYDVFQSLNVDESPPPPGSDSDIVPLCDLNVTCGNAVCDPYCENVSNCPADCQGEPPVGCGSPCASDAVCAGLGPNPACVNGACYDGQTCGGETPAGGDNGGDGGEEDGGQCSSSVCGDGKCDFPACEDSMSCPADCFG